MGMFDNVIYEAPCWNCGTKLRGWQTKDTGCTLDSVTPQQIGDGVFYDSCDECDAWNQYRVIPPKEIEIVPDDDRPKL